MQWCCGNWCDAAGGSQELVKRLIGARLTSLLDTSPPPPPPHQQHHTGRCRSSTARRSSTAQPPKQVQAGRGWRQPSRPQKAAPCRAHICQSALTVQHAPSHAHCLLGPSPQPYTTVHKFRRLTRRANSRSRGRCCCTLLTAPACYAGATGLTPHTTPSSLLGAHAAQCRQHAAWCLQESSAQRRGLIDRLQPSSSALPLLELLHEALVELPEALNKLGHLLLTRQDGCAQVEGALGLAKPAACEGSRAVVGVQEVQCERVCVSTRELCVCVCVCVCVCACVRACVVMVQPPSPDTSTAKQGPHTQECLPTPPAERAHLALC
jgi:hypothetical protein